MIYDFILTGYGAANLSMLHHIMHHPSFKNKSILILDDSNGRQINKTWCFWDNGNVPYQSAKKFYWNRLAVIGKQRKIATQLKESTYYHIKSEDLYQELQLLVATRNNIHYKTTKVTGLKGQGEIVKVISEDAIFEARFVINTIPKFNSNNKTKYHLTQNFLGWKVESDNPVFNRKEAVLMDYRGTDEPSAFFYVLPYSEKYALVEFTRFSKDIADRSFYENQLHAYIAEQLNISSYQIVEEEFGVIPMTDYPYKRKLSKRIYQLGTAGGDTKTTTGYTFKNIQKSCRAVLHEIETGKGFPKKKSRFAFYDRLLLDIILRRPILTERIMLSLFKNNSFDQVFKFLDEETSLLEEMKIFWGLPWPPFIKTLFAKKQALYEVNPQSIDSANKRSLVPIDRG